MYVKLSFQEKTQAACMSLNLMYALAENPTIIDTLPPDVKVNNQNRVADEPALNEMFGPFNACHYDYYVDCGDADKETITKILEALLSACGGKLPAIQADEQYFSENQNLIANALTFCLAALKHDKNIDNQTLKNMVKKEIRDQMVKHEKESMKKFFSFMMFGNENDQTHSEQLDKMLSVKSEEEFRKVLEDMNTEPENSSSAKLGM